MVFFFYLLRLSAFSIMPKKDAIIMPENATSPQKLGFPQKNRIVAGIDSLGFLPAPTISLGVS
jgi:hypothetical protein